jgi:hypothetical protein
LQLTPAEVIEAVTRGLNRGEADFGVKGRSILSCICGHPDWNHGTLKLGQLLFIVLKFQYNINVADFLFSYKNKHVLISHKNIKFTVRCKGVKVSTVWLYSMPTQCAGLGGTL